VGVILCIFISAYFSGTETALTALSDIKSSELSEKWKFISPILRKWSKDPSQVLSSILIGNNVVNILGALFSGKLAYHFFIEYGQAAADVIAVAAMTLAVLIFGEITPKTFANIKPEKWTVPALFVFRFISWAIFPFSFILSKFAKKLVKVMGGDDKSSGLTQTDIEYIIKQGSDKGIFEQEEQGDLLTSVIEFKDTLVKEIMTPRTDSHFLESDTTIAESLEKVKEWGHSRIPVFEDSVDNIKGILYVKDLVGLLSRKDFKTGDTVDTILREKVNYVPETQKINETLKTMQAGETHMSIVVDEFGGTAGIITLEDIIEELVGDIKDEDDKEDDLIVPLREGVNLVSAHISIGDLEEELDIEIPDDGDYNSLGGFIVSEVGSVPEVGFRMKYKEHEFSIVESNEKHIVKVEIRKLEEEEIEEESDEESE
jgi:CBS domain containing-hemolysin-like protein